MMNQEVEVIGTVSAICDIEKRSEQKMIWQGVQRFDQFSLPYPTVLVGGGIALWDNLKYDVCPGCHGRPLAPYEYCLRCDAWGLDKKQTHEKFNIQMYIESEAGMVNVKDRRKKRWTGKKYERHSTS